MIELNEERKNKSKKIIEEKKKEAIIPTVKNFDKFIEKEHQRTGLAPNDIVDGLSEHGFGIVEFICACPTNWALSPVDCLKFIDDAMLPEFPLGEYKNVESIDYSLPTKEIGGITARPGGA